MAFEEFIPSRTSSRKPLVTIGAAGRLLFNVSAVAEFVKECKYAKLYYDAEANRIGIKLLTEREPHCVTIARGGKTNRNSASLTVKSFLIHYKIDAENKRLNGLPCVMDDAQGMLVVQLPA